ncbi:hypothetical protein HO133_009800 [Letharia lupina]|uniref:Uncharacterized protein n=1 Tax=Letharia lupina TaxID=560253 RepID=A0A8H6FFC5_9LECA|nr:uncharacterized protein HO133_009800 [Letharia lupina]KAF6225798.1 hypothetical protein HO133_009800 [Letharia lupina]
MDVLGDVAVLALPYPFSLDPSKGNTNHFATPPNFWTTAEVSIGLLAACMPPLNPLIRRAPSSLNIDDSINTSLALRRSDRSKTSERLSSVEITPKIHEFNEGKMVATKRADIEMSDYGSIEVDESASIGKVV